VFVPDWEDVPDEVIRRSRPGDVVVTMGAPPISLMGDELLSALAEADAASLDGAVLDGPSAGASDRPSDGSE
jgi:hypothetical protein